MKDFEEKHRFLTSGMDLVVNYMMRRLKRDQEILLIDPKKPVSGTVKFRRYSGLNAHGPTK
jgi:hypothetical protein